MILIMSKFNLLSEQKRNSYKEKLRKDYKDLPDEILDQLIDYLLSLAIWETSIHNKH